MIYDKIILGAGLYGLYAALHCGRKGQSVLVLEKDPEPFMRATYINQARVHMGYHYPRSYATAVKSAGYFRRFEEDFAFCLHRQFDQVYATGTHFSWTNAAEFQRFCNAAGIFCEPVPTGRYFKQGMCDGAFLTHEYTYDAQILKAYYLEQLQGLKQVQLLCGRYPVRLEAGGGLWQLQDQTGETFRAPYVLNATYAGVNDVHALLGLTPFAIKYELCEIILCTVAPALEKLGVTVMDGPFFSIMPFGKTGLHSLTSVTFTPHATSFCSLAEFPCQQGAPNCSVGNLGNCNACPNRPQSAWPYMSQLARTYLKEEFGFSYKGSLFSMKPILRASEVDDSRPTVVRVMYREPTLVSVLSGKINTVYDLDEVL